MKADTSKAKNYTIWALIVLLLAALAFAGGYFARGGGGEKDGAEKSVSKDGTGEMSAKKIEYTCAMHPQIRELKPGICPICNMDLVPVEAGDGGSLREYTMSESAKKLAEIEVSEVERKYVTAEVRLVGKVDYDETKLGHITAYFPGRLDQLYVDYTGIPVIEGHKMATIYSPELYSAQADLHQAIEAAKELGESNIEEIKKSAQMTVEAVREKFRLWGFTDEQIGEMEERGEPSDRMDIQSPMTGIVIEKHAVEGMYVKTGMRIYTIADLSRVWVKLDAYESDLQWLRYGQTVSFTTEAFPGKTFEGKIAFIDPVVNPKTRTIKVRVNVPNENGRLKPDMFVRAIVRSNVAAGGNVMDPELAGKWISPMHPEIIKDGPGICDICGIPLVRAEDLGYVGASEENGTKPLVIPATAPLITGKRAVVYVQVPDKDKPTYEGREIVLGPRAKDYYIVRGGLEEGELVVTNGAFKIDSALQLLAKPSMMTPKGGVAGGGHQHGDQADHAMTGKEMGTGQVNAPWSFLTKLKTVEKAYDGVSAAIESESTEEIVSAFAQLEEVLNSIDSEMLNGDAEIMWRELSMLLKNDAVEGRYSEDLDEARQTATELDRHMERVRTAFGVVRESATARFDVPAGFRKQLQELINAYLSVQDALASDDMETAKKAASSMKEKLDAVDMGLLDHEAHMAWMKESDILQTLVHEIEWASDIQTLREGFALLSDELAAVAKMFSLGDEKPLYRIRCPMAFDNRGATWLQTDEDVRNPYFGASMLKCGDVIEEYLSR